MKISPSFQFYVGDWLKSQRVALMTLEEEGAYIRLLCYCWQYGSIPADKTKLAFLIGKGASTTLATTLATMFQPDPYDPSKLIHERLNEEKEKQRLWREKSSKGGKLSALKRIKPKKKQAVAPFQPPLQPPFQPPFQPPLQPPLQPPFQPKGNSSVCSLQFASTSTKEEKALKALARFEKFWAEYPKKKSKGAAEKIFMRINPSEQLMEKIIFSLRQAKTSGDWTKNDGKFIPYPATWLNAKGWEDEPIVSQKKDIETSLWDKAFMDRGMGGIND